MEKKDEEAGSEEENSRRPRRARPNPAHGQPSNDESISLHLSPGNEEDHAQETRSTQPDSTHSQPSNDGTTSESPPPLENEDDDDRVDNHDAIARPSTRRESADENRAEIVEGIQASQQEQSGSGQDQSGSNQPQVSQSQLVAHTPQPQSPSTAEQQANTQAVQPDYDHSDQQPTTVSQKHQAPPPPAQNPASQADVQSQSTQQQQASQPAAPGQTPFQTLIPPAIRPPAAPVQQPAPENPYWNLRFLPLALPLNQFPPVQFPPAGPQPPPRKYRCTGTTKQGKRCRVLTTNRSRRCWRHAYWGFR